MRKGQLFKSTKLLWISISAIVLTFAALCALWINTVRLEKVQNEALNILQERRGEYNEQKIVLYDTSLGEARKLSEMFGADLRITSNGNFATLTLPEGTTIEDIFTDDKNRQYISDMSADYATYVSDVAEIDSHGRYNHKRPKYIVSDSEYEKQTYLDYLNLENAWSTSKGSNVLVAVIDTGIDTDHPEFIGRISEYSYNASEDRVVKDFGISIIEDEQGHGTAVAGALAAAMGNEGITGIAPSAKLLVIKAECDEAGRFVSTSDLVFGLYYAIEQGADVVNMSFGGLENLFADAAQLAVDSDVVCVASAGNDSSTILNYPAADLNVIGVGALEENGWELAEYSNYGENVDLVAPGTVYTTSCDGGFSTVDGTSLASPLVAGAIALYLEDNRYDTVTEVKEMLYASCTDLGSLGHDWYFGYGALDIYSFVCGSRGKITFNMLSDELDNVEATFIRGKTLQSIVEPERLYAVFDGWYYDEQCTEEYQLYSDVFTSDLTLYAKWVNEDDGIPYTYVTLDDGTVEIRSYTGKRRYITIPDTIDGMMVSSIGENAFKGQNKLREITLPSHLVNIGRSAFEECSNLTEIRIPSTVQTIGNRAFFGNVRLNAVAFDDGASLKSIGMFAFSECPKIARIELPNSLEMVDGSAFFGNTSLVSVSVKGGSKYFASKDGVLFNRTASELVVYPAGRRGAYTVPSSVKTVGAYAFGYSCAEEIIVSNAETIGTNAFAYSKLENFVMPDSVTKIENGIFLNAQYLTDVKLSEGISVISEKAFAGTALDSIYIPAKVLQIGKEAFRFAELKSVTFAENISLTVIHEEAFRGCGLVELQLPASLVTIGVKAFADNFDLEKVVFKEAQGFSMMTSDAQTIGAQAFENTYSLEKIELPSGFSYLGKYAFLNSGISEVLIPKSLETIDVGAFASCKNLVSVSVENGNKYYTAENNILYTADKKTLVLYPAGLSATSYTTSPATEIIGGGAFYGANNLKTVTLSNVVSVGETAFYGCKKITSYKLSQNLESIGEYAFSQNDALTKIEIPDSVTQIARYAFAFDYSLKTITLKDTSALPRIGLGTFAYTGITSMKIPANVSTMGQGAFWGCDSLTSITFAANSKLATVASYMFDGAKNLQSVTFESGSALKTLGAHAFEGLSMLTTVNFGDAKLTEIGNYAFRFCEKLTSLNVPDSLLDVGRLAFYGARSLEELALPASLEHIGSHAFFGAENLDVYFASDFMPIFLDEYWDEGIRGYYLGVKSVTTEGDWSYATLNSGKISIIDYLGNDSSVDLASLDLGADIIGIGGKAFEFSEITSVVLPNNLKNIQAGAFANSKIKSITIPENVDFIGREAFFNTPIESLTFKSGSKLRSMELRAFAYTEKLREVTLPASLEVMGSEAFLGSGIASLTFEQGIKLSEIPSLAFAKTAITAVEIPDSVTLVNHGAFRENMNLKAVTFGKADAVRLESNVFYGTGLENISIPANVTFIGEYAFVGLENLKAFEVDGSNPNYAAVDGLLVSKDGRKLIAVPAGRSGALSVPANIEVIGFGAFENTVFNSVSFDQNANILSFGYRAFYNAKNITKIRVPASVVAIDYYAFANCAKLESVEFAEGNSLRGIYEGAFYGASSLKNIELPDSVVEISDFAFYGCLALDRIPVSETNELKGIYSYAFAHTGITELVIPESVVDIGDYAFKGIKITEVTVPETNKEELVLGIGVFNDCNSLERITLPFIGSCFEDREITWLGYIFGAGDYEANPVYTPESLKDVTITDGISFFGTGAFYNLRSIENVNAPHSVTALYSYSFCTDESSTGNKLKMSIEFTNDVYFVKYNGELESDPSSILYVFPTGVYGKVKFADGLKLLSTTFYMCSALTEVQLPDGVTEIGYACFEGCSNLEKINIPQTLTELGHLAFSGCKKLESLHFPEGITTFGQHTFSRCSSLKEVNIPSTVTRIQLSAFNNCVSLTEIVLPESLLTIENTAFGGCIGLKEIKIPKGVTVVERFIFSGCENLEKVVIDGNVTKIAKQAFYNCNSLSSINIPDSVTNIEEYAFGNCYSLRNIKLPSSLTTIGETAFSYCTGLSEIIIPEGVTTIDKQAFFNCSGLSSVTVPSTLTTIGLGAFTSCDNLFEIYNNSDISLTFDGTDNGNLSKNAKVIVDKDGNRVYKSDDDNFVYVDTKDGFRFIKENDEYKLISYMGDKDEVILPSDIQGNSYTIYQMRGVKNVIIPEIFTTIPEKAFFGCDSLENITLHSAITEICAEAFQYCKSLASITVPGSVKIIREQAFARCDSLEEIILEEGVESLSTNTFSRCAKLSYLAIPDSLKSLGYQAFYQTPVQKLEVNENNPNFTYIDGVLYDKEVTKIIWVDETAVDVCIPQTINSIGTNFAGHTNLRSVRFENGTPITSIPYKGFENCSNLVSFEMPEGVTSIGSYAFRGCGKLKNVVLPENIKNIGGYAFSGCCALEKVIIPSQISKIESNLFAYCSELKEVHIPKGVTKIENSAFIGCTNISNIVVEDGNSTFNFTDGMLISGDQIILASKSLEGVVKIPEGVKSIGSVFADCKGITEIVLPDSLTSIGSLENCTSLENIHIPASVTTISQDAFDGCTNLQSITLDENNSTFRLNDGMLYNSTSILYVLPTASGHIVVPDGITSISEGFAKNTSITGITLPDSVTSIPNGAFRGCRYLREVNIPETVTVIGSSAFDGCSSLISIKLPSKITVISSRLFGDCKALVSIDIPEGVTQISGSAFSKCYSLRKVTLPSTLKTIGTLAFLDADIDELINNSDLPLSAYSGATYGYLSASLVVDKNGNRTFSNPDNSFEFIDTDDGFRFKKYSDGSYALVAYFGGNDTVTLPKTINGSTYTIYKLAGVRNVIIPDGVTTIDVNAFANSAGLTSVSFPNSLIEIKNFAFTECINLNNVVIPNGVIAIGTNVFLGATSLSNIELPDSIKNIGANSFKDTAYYNDSKNWSNNVLYIGNHVVGASKDITAFLLGDSSRSIIAYAFKECYLLKYVEVIGDNPALLSDARNLETLVIATTSNDYVRDYFRFSTIPNTLKNIVLKEGVIPRKGLFSGFTDITIYLEASKHEAQWDDATFAGWNNGNKVVYGDEWIYGTFYDKDGGILSRDIFGVSEIIRIPYYAIEPDEQFVYELMGWDVNGDGVADTIPASSPIDVSATPIVKKSTRLYTVSFLDSDGVTPITTLTLPYGSAVTAPNTPEKAGYKFVEWVDFDSSITVEGDMSFTSSWIHVGGMHDYDAPVWVAPTCTEQGYYKHICKVCGEYYGSDYTVSLGHDYVMVNHAPTCTERGYDEWLCGCGDSYKTNYLPAVGHSFGEWISESESSCISDGYGYRVCACGEREYGAVVSEGHRYVGTVIKDATCYETGEILYVCAVCEDELVERTPMIDHSYVKTHVNKSLLQMLIEWVLNVFIGYEGDEAYCFKCVDCGDYMTSAEARSYSASVQGADCTHAPCDWSVGVAATCVKDGLEYKLCALCGKATEARAIEASGHVYDDENDTTCSVCGDGEIIFGDVNGDGYVSSDDAIRLLRHTLDPEIYLSMCDGDMNRDGYVNSEDAIYLLRHVLDPTKYPLEIAK